MAELFLLAHSIGFQESNQSHPDAMVVASKQFNVFGVLGALTPEFIPGQFSFSIVIGVRKTDFSISHTIRIIFGKHDESPLVDSGENTIRPNKAISSSSGTSYSILGAQLTNVIFKEAGEYVTSVYWDGELMRSEHIAVEQRMPSE